MLPPKTENKARMSGLTTFIQHCAGRSSQSSKPRRENQCIWIRMQERKLPLFADDTIIYVDNAKESIRKLLELILEMSKYTGYTVNIQNSTVFLHTSIEHMDTKIKNYNATHNHLKKFLAVKRQVENYTLETVLC